MIDASESIKFRLTCKQQFWKTAAQKIKQTRNARYFEEYFFAQSDLFSVNKSHR